MLFKHVCTPNPHENATRQYAVKDDGAYALASGGRHMDLTTYVEFIHNNLLETSGQK